MLDDEPPFDDPPRELPFDEERPFDEELPLDEELPFEDEPLLEEEAPLDVLLDDELPRDAEPRDDAELRPAEVPRLDDAFAPLLPLLLLLDDLLLDARPPADLEPEAFDADDFEDLDDDFAPVERVLEPFEEEVPRPVLRDEEAELLRDAAEDLLPPLLAALLRDDPAAERPDDFELFDVAALRAGAAFFAVERLDEAELFFAVDLRAVDFEEAFAGDDFDDDLLPEDFDDDFEPDDFDDDLEAEDFEPDDDFEPLPEDDFLDDAVLFFDAAMCFSFFKKFAWGVVLF